MGILLRSLAALAACAALAAQAQLRVSSTLPAGTDPSAIAVDSQAGRVFVANEGSGDVTVIEPGGASFRVPVGPRPQHIAVNPATGRAYVSNGGDSTLAVVDPVARTATRLAIGGTGRIAIDSGANRIYIARFGNADEVTELDGATNTWHTMATESFTAVDVAVDGPAQRLYVAHYTTGDVRIVDLSTGSDFPPTQSIGMWARPVALALDAPAHRLFVLTEDSRGPIGIVDTATATARFLAPEGHAKGPRAIVVNPLTHRAYAAFDGEVVAIDGASGAMTFFPMPTPVALALDPTTGRVYAPSSSGTITVIDGASAWSAPIPEGARDVAVDPTTHKAYVAGPQVSVVEGAGGPPPPRQRVNAQGLWWAAPAGAESGWGLFLAQQGETVFAVWFTYDAAGAPTWFVASDLRRGAGDSYSGTLYRTSGPPLGAAFDPARVSISPVGSAAITFADRDHGTFAWSADGKSGSKAITRQVYSTLAGDCAPDNDPPPTPNRQDLWWRSPAGSESGWGLGLTHQGDVLFATWFTYDASGKPTWYVGSNVGRGDPGTYSGTLYRTAGSPFDAPWNPAAARITPVGSVSFAFEDADHGEMTYRVDALAGTQPITRQVFDVPASVCR
ncbi:MAG TPA: YncE family protein [Usitatibacter sp.]